MTVMWTMLSQIILMFLLVLIGFAMTKFGKISSESGRDLGNILIYISLPCVILRSFLVECTVEKIECLIISVLVAALSLGISLLISRLVFKEDAIANFSAAFSNPGFFGVPLITATLLDGSAFYVAAFIGILNVLQWTYGVSLLTKERSALSIKKICTAPFIIAILIGIFFFLTGFSMPKLLDSGISLLAGMNTPLAMFVTGIYLIDVNPAEMLRHKSLYIISLVRLIIVPLLTLLMLCLLPSNLFEMKMALLIVAACPVGSNVIVYSKLHRKNCKYAVESVILTTLLSVITIPALVGFASSLWMV
ncbi:MAG: AEC family transporter [Clostridiales bacterium]|nr:AEC family transporter [Clostridiales bacterium]